MKKKRSRALVGALLLAVSLGVIGAALFCLLWMSQAIWGAAFDGAVVHHESVQDFAVRVIFWSALVVAALPFACIGAFMLGLQYASRMKDRGEPALTSSCVSSAGLRRFVPVTVSAPPFCGEEMTTGETTRPKCPLCGGELEIGQTSDMGRSRLPI